MLRVSFMKQQCITQSCESRAQAGTLSSWDIRGLRMHIVWSWRNRRAHVHRPACTDTSVPTIVSGTECVRRKQVDVAQFAPMLDADFPICALGVCAGKSPHFGRRTRASRSPGLLPSADVRARSQFSISHMRGPMAHFTATQPECFV